MATEASFTVPSDQFPLGTVFEQFPDVTVELERVIPAGSTMIPYFWVRGTEIDDIDSAFLDHPGIETIRLVDSVASQYLLRVEWATEYDGVLSTVLETNILLMEAVGTSNRWTFDIRGDDRQDVAAFRERCQELAIPITLTRLNALTPIESETAAALTEAQREALVLAHRRGYFNTPREVTMTELGVELDISQQAVASRLRRGIDAILDQTLPEEPTP